MGMICDIPEENMPGAGLDFQDVTNIFTAGAADMDPGSICFVESLSLMDAMAAFEIGEPRLDSGMETEEDKQPPFDVRTPLLPEEICWIMDRAVSYEMEWHAGNLLSHTVYTLLYIHHLNDLDVDLIPQHCAIEHDSSRPLELITVVLRSFVMALLKCCDLSWRELSKGSVLDAEDWQGDKCDISLLEGVPTKHVLSLLDQAEIWLASAPIQDNWREALLVRIRLRKAFMQLLNADIFDTTAFQLLVDVGLQQLLLIHAFSAKEPVQSSPARRAFDPRVGRHLKTFIPLRVIPLPPQEQTWVALEGFFRAWKEFSVLSRTHNLSTWNLVGSLRNWMPDAPLCAPYLRSYAQSVFYDGHLILNKFNFPWLIERFFFETLGVTYDFIVKTIQICIGDELMPLAKVERVLAKLMTPYISGHWLNPPRRRRRLVNSLVDWHSLYDVLVEISCQLGASPLPIDHIVSHIPKAALLWRLSSIREIILSGFQLELYAKEERPIAYWYAVKVLDEHLACLDDLLPLVDKDSSTYRETQFQFQWLTALQALSLACFVASMSCISFNWTTMAPNFQRRYKWIHQAEYEETDTRPVGHPVLEDLMLDVQEILEMRDFSPLGQVNMAGMILGGLAKSGNVGGWAGGWGEDRLKMVSGLIKACQALKDVPESVVCMEAEEWDAGRLKWDVLHHPWFPVCSSEEKEKGSC